MYDNVPLIALDVGYCLDDGIVFWKQPAVTLVFDVGGHAGSDAVDGGHEVFAGDLEEWEVIYVENCLCFGDAVGEGWVCGREGAVVGLQL